jgi:hypothetical protein
MDRTNIFLEPEQLRALKRLAAEERTSLGAIVRRAVDAYLAERGPERDDWGERFDALVARVQRRLPPAVTPEQIEADITAARAEVRHARRAARPPAGARGR